MFVNSVKWNGLRQLLHVTHRSVCLGPSPDDLADMLEEVFPGHPSATNALQQFSEPNWTQAELNHAIQKMQNNKDADECGLVAELLKNAPGEFLMELLKLMSDMLQNGQVPTSWHKTLSQMLPKKARANPTTDFRPIANIRLLYKIFAYLVLGRVEGTLDLSQPDEQHGFRNNRRMEKTFFLRPALWWTRPS